MFALLRDRLSTFWLNFLAGLLIVAALVAMQQTSFVKSWEDWAVDVMIRLNAGLQRVTGFRQGRDDLRFAMLDMDEMSYRHKTWNEPYHAPRDKVLRLIQFAVKGRASIIIVDVDLTKKGSDKQADAELMAYLNAYPASAPPLILMRPKRARLGGDLRGAGEFRPSLMKQSDHANIFYAQPLFQRDNRDRVVRRWILMEPGCFNGKGLALPSVQLLTYAILRDKRVGGGHRFTDSLYRSLDNNRPTGCAQGPFKPARRPLMVGKIRFNQNARAERLIYTIQWPKLSLGGEDGGGAAYEAHDLNTIPAAFVTDRNYKGYDEVSGRVTIIGASYEASHDLHLTPLGLMPGSLIIINAVKSLSLFQQISQPSLYLRLPLLLGFVLMISVVFSYVNNFLKLIVVVPLVLLAFVPISFWLFKYGVWFDFGLLLLAIKLQHSLMDYFEIRELKVLKKKLKKRDKWEQVKLISVVLHQVM